jgi:hypothetical protein
MRETPYPMAAVRTQRDLQRREAVAELAAAKNELAKAEANLDAARSARGELQRLRAAGPRSADTHARGSAVMRAGAYASRLQSRVRELETQLRAAEQALAERQRRVRLAELNVNEAHAQRELLERHYAQFRANERKVIERAEELEVEESRRHPVLRG